MDGTIDCAVRRDDWQQCRFTSAEVPVPAAPVQVWFRTSPERP